MSDVPPPIVPQAIVDLLDLCPSDQVLEIAPAVLSRIPLSASPTPVQFGWVTDADLPESVKWIFIVLVGWLVAAAAFEPALIWMPFCATVSILAWAMVMTIRVGIRTGGASMPLLHDASHVWLVRRANSEHLMIHDVARGDEPPPVRKVWLRWSAFFDGREVLLQSQFWPNDATGRFSRQYSLSVSSKQGRSGLRQASGQHPGTDIMDSLWVPAQGESRETFLAELARMRQFGRRVATLFGIPFREGYDLR